MLSQAHASSFLCWCIPWDGDNRFGHGIAFGRLGGYFRFGHDVSLDEGLYRLLFVVFEDGRLTSVHCGLYIASKYLMELDVSSGMARGRVSLSRGGGTSESLW